MMNQQIATFCCGLLTIIIFMNTYLYLMKYLIFLLSSILFTIVFYNQSPGINVFAFTLSCLLGLFYLKKIKLPTLLSKLVFISLLTSGFFVVYHHTFSALIIHVVNWILFVGVLNFPTAKRLSSWIYIGVVNSIIGFFSALKSKSKPNSKNRKRIKLKLYLIPIGIIFIFLAIYRASNPVFDQFIGQITEVIFKPFTHLNLDYFPTYLLGVFLTLPLYFSSKHPEIEKADLSSNDSLTRIRVKRRFSFKMKGLTNEYQAGVFLLFVLNILLVIVNVFDIYAVWFNFKFEGQTLKTFIHQGTYMLIFSILISIGVVLYFFRNNLNFYALNTKLKTLTYIWILQNIVLTGSVFARCYHYINHFGLAYKRIGVIVFLLAVIVGLITVYIKVKNTKSIAYLWRVNLLSLFILLNSLTFFNWDVLIATYNIANYKKSYVHLIYLSQLSDNALFALQLTPDHLEHISAIQQKRYTFSSFESSKLNLNSDEFHERINNRIVTFKQNWENKHWLSWNYAEYKCYRQLIN